MFDFRLFLEIKLNYNIFFHKIINEIKHSLFPHFQSFFLIFHKQGNVVKAAHFFYKSMSSNYAAALQISSQIHSSIKFHKF